MKSELRKGCAVRAAIVPVVEVLKPHKGSCKNRKRQGLKAFRRFPNRCVKNISRLGEILSSFYVWANSGLG
ncbi:hypothetical protein LXL04_002115 [Taraxacum kok-saghyz]